MMYTALHNRFISLSKSHVDIHNQMYIYTYKHIKYINPFFTELQETKGS